MIETGFTIQDVRYTDAEGNVKTSVHTYRDLGLILATYYIPEPKVKEKRIDIPFASGSIDLTESAGYIPYEDRDGISFEFVMKNRDYEDYNSKIHIINNLLHGRKVKIILDTDPNYYYSMRLNLDSTKNTKLFSKVKISGTAEPFKYSVLASNEPWLWDTFNFYTGVIEESTSDIVVNGSKEVIISGGAYLTAPTFYVYESENLAVTFEDNVYNLPKESIKTYELYRFPQIKIGGGEDGRLIFTGKGRVSIEYRGRYL